MRSLLLLLLFPLALHSTAQSGDERTVRTLFTDPADTVTGGYFAITGKSFRTLGQDAFLLGGRLGLVIGHRLSIGLAGYGMCSPLKNTAYNDYRLQHELNLPDGMALRMGYGGLFVEPTFFDRSVVHFSIPITFGAGGAAYGYRTQSGRYSSVVHTDAQTFFFVEPAVDVEVNILRGLRLGLGASYLYTSDIDLPATGADVFRQPMFQVTLKMGEF